MQIPLRTFSVLVENMAAAVQASASQLLDLAVGSTFRALLEANASIGLWMQWLVLLVLRTTRASTSTGPDLDSWMAGMTLTRLPASCAVGIVTFSRFTPTTAALVPAGALVRSSDGAQIFSVSIDLQNAAWSATSNGYIISAGSTSLDVSVVARAPGKAGNIQAGTISLLASAMPGIDSVTNASGTQNGIDAESDAAFRVRFVDFIASRSRATLSSIGYAVSSVQQGLSYSIQENVDPTGKTFLGSFVVTVDDGIGFPSAVLLSTIQSAIDAVRPVGSIFSVQAPTVMSAVLSMNITVTIGTTKALVQALAGNALISYVDNLLIGEHLPLTKLAQIAYEASPAIVNVSQVLINGNENDLVPGVTGVIKTGTVAVN
jgi:phage-related baseplate assembly protein